MINYKNNQETVDKHQFKLLNKLDQTFDDASVLSEEQYFLRNSRNVTDIQVWEDLEQHCDDFPVFNDAAALQIIHNSMESARINNDLNYHISRVIDHVLQVSEDPYQIFERSNLHVYVIQSFGENAPYKIIMSLFSILETYLTSARNTNVSIKWASELLERLNDQIMFGIMQKDVLMSSYLSISAILLEKGEYGIETGQKYFQVYINIIRMLSNYDLQLGLLNFSIILKKISLLYDTLITNNEIMNFLISRYPIRNPKTVEPLCSIFCPLISKYPNFFMINNFIEISMIHLRDENSDDTVTMIMKCLAELCSSSVDACQLLVENGFVGCNNFVRYGFRPQRHILSIMHSILTKFYVNNEPITVRFIDRNVIAFLESDDESAIEIVLALIPKIVENKIEIGCETVEKIKCLAFGENRRIAELAQSLVNVFKRDGNEEEEECMI